MSHWLRIVYVLIGTVANAIQALFYFRIGGEIFPLIAEGGKYHGPFSDTLTWLKTAWMLEIVIVQLALLAYLIYGPIMKERARSRVVSQ